MFHTNLIVIYIAEEVFKTGNHFYDIEKPHNVKNPK